MSRRKKDKSQVREEELDASACVSRSSLVVETNVSRKT